jgi:hypothetical protein
LTLVADASLALLAGTVGALNAIGRKQHLAHAATKRVWKDAVLVRAGPTVDMVVDVSNPGLRGWRTATSPNTPRQGRPSQAAMRSATMMVGRLVPAAGIDGITEASATRSRSTP